MASGSFSHHHSAADEYRRSGSSMAMTTRGMSDVERYQLHDTPMPHDASDRISMFSGSRSNSHSAATLASMPSRRETTISFAVDTSSTHDRPEVRVHDFAPNAYHSPSSPSPLHYATEPPQHLNTGHSLSAIREGSNGSGSAEKAGSSPTSSKYLDPFASATAQTPVLPRSGAGDIRSMWEQSKDDLGPDADADIPSSPTEEKDRDSLSSSPSSSPTHARSERHFPKGHAPGGGSRGGGGGGAGGTWPRSRSNQRDGDEEDEEETELLSPRMGRRDSVEEEERAKTAGSGSGGGNRFGRRSN